MDWISAISTRRKIEIVANLTSHRDRSSFWHSISPLLQGAKRGASLELTRVSRDLITPSKTAGNSRKTIAASGLFIWPGGGGACPDLTVKDRRGCFSTAYQRPASFRKNPKEAELKKPETAKGTCRIHPLLSHAVDGTALTLEINQSALSKKICDF